MNNNNAQARDMQTDNMQPGFKWDAPELYTETWLKTLGGNDKSTTEDTAFHT